MKREQIIAMAQEAGMEVPDNLNTFWEIWTPELERFAALVAAYEREECAALADRLFNRAMNGDEVADAIRARGNDD